MRIARPASASKLWTFVSYFIIYSPLSPFPPPPPSLLPPSSSLLPSSLPPPPPSLPPLPPSPSLLPPSLPPPSLPPSLLPLPPSPSLPPPSLPPPPSPPQVLLQSEQRVTVCPQPSSGKCGSVTSQSVVARRGARHESESPTTATGAAARVSAEGERATRVQEIHSGGTDGACSESCEYLKIAHDSLGCSKSCEYLKRFLNS